MASGINLFALSTLLFGLTACAKKEEVTAAPETPPEVSREVEAQFIPPPTANPNAANVQERLQGAVHPQMTELLIKFKQTYGRMPESFSEFVNRMMDSIPPLPPGMKYEIDPTDTSVKIVRK